jgi:predicted Zn finger-like uncharacterized protein
MIVICSNCEARLQLDENKLPSQAFKVRCPKCQASIEVKSTSIADTDAEDPLSLSAEANPGSKQTSAFEPPPTAAPFKPVDTAKTASSNQNTPSSNDLTRLLAEALLQNETASTRVGSSKRPAWDRRTALVCTSPNCRETIASGLVAHDYDVFVAENTPQALGRMREDRIDVLVLDGTFDQGEQGLAFLTREVKLMRPAERRRLFLVYLTPSARTMDLHAAFLHNVNLIINPSDVERLPDALEVSIRHYNELYRDFNRALDAPAI